MSNYLSKPALWFWIVSALALIWNLFGVMAYLMQVLMTHDDYALLPESERLMYENLPAWYTGVFAVAVFAGAIGSIALLIRKRWAYSLFLISLLGVAIQQAYLLIIINPEGLVLNLCIIVIAIFLVWFSKKAVTLKWIT